jgi:glutamine amidotransferase
MLFLANRNTQEEFSGGKIKGPRPQLYRTIQPPLNEPDFHSFCKNSSSLCVLAHIRMATGVVHLYNNHPFQFGRHILQHNGSVAHFDQIRWKLCDKMSAKALLNVRGSADSEHVGEINCLISVRAFIYPRVGYTAGLYMTYLGEDWEMQYSVEEMKTALFKTIDTIIQLQIDLKLTQTQPSSLNICVTDGEQLVGIRFRNVEGGVHQPPVSSFLSFAQ